MCAAGGASGVEAGHRAEFVGDEAIGAGAGEFVLVADALVMAHPVSEEAGHDEADDGRGHGAAAAAGGVGGVLRDEFGVEFAGEERAGGGFDRAGFEFDPPLVAAVGAAGERAGDEGGDVEIGDGPAVALGDGDKRVGEVFFGDAFGEGVEQLWEASEVNQAMGRGGGETDDVAENVAAETAGGGDENDVGLVGADGFERKGFGGERRWKMRGVIGEREEFEEDAGVTEEPKAVGGSGVLGGDEAFGGGVDFVKDGFGAGELAKFVLERGERRAAVDDAFEVGPDGAEGERKGFGLAERGREVDQPRRQAGEERDVEAAGVFEDGLDAAGPIGDRGDGGGGGLEVALDPRGEIERGDAGDIAEERRERAGGRKRGERGRAAEEQVAAVENLRVAVPGGVVEKRARARAAEVGEEGGGDGEEFGFAVGAGGAGEMRAATGPEDIGFALSHATHERFDVRVGAERRAGLELGVGETRFEAGGATGGGGGEAWEKRGESAGLRGEVEARVLQVARGAGGPNASADHVEGFGQDRHRGRVSAIRRQPGGAGAASGIRGRGGRLTGF